MFLKSIKVSKRRMSRFLWSFHLERLGKEFPKMGSQRLRKLAGHAADTDFRKYAAGEEFTLVYRV